MVVKDRGAVSPAGVAVVVGEVGLGLVRFHGSSISFSSATLHSGREGLGEVLETVRA